MKKLIACLLVLVVAGMSFSYVTADEPSGLATKKLSQWTVIKPSPASDVTRIESEIGESYLVENRGYLVTPIPYGTFVLEGDITPEPGQNVNGANYIDNQVITFSGTGENGGLPSPNAPYEPQGSCYKIQLVQGTLYFQYVDPVQGDRMIKAVQLGAGGVPANWNTFAAPGTFHFKLSVDIETQHVTFWVQKRNVAPDEGLVKLLDISMADPAYVDFPFLEWGRITMFNRNTAGGVSFDCNFTAVTLIDACQIPLPPMAPPPCEGGDGQEMPMYAYDPDGY